MWIGRCHSLNPLAPLNCIPQSKIFIPLGIRLSSLCIQAISFVFLIVFDLDKNFGILMSSSTEHYLQFFLLTCTTGKSVSGRFINHGYLVCRLVWSCLQKFISTNMEPFFIICSFCIFNKKVTFLRFLFPEVERSEYRLHHALLYMCLNIYRILRRLDTRFTCQKVTIIFKFNLNSTDKRSRASITMWW